jgi:thymidylate synthase ThyX
MAKTYSYRPDLQIVSIKTESPIHHIAVHSLLQNTGKKQPSITAYLGARYSRSADSILDIAAEAYEQGVDAADRLERIFTGYGHKSVGDMADLFICIENIPLLLGKKLFNQIPVLAGQERSTRYQNYSKPDYISLPAGPEIPEKIRQGYEAIIKKAYRDYTELLAETKRELGTSFKISPEDKALQKVLEARSFDTARYLIPQGACTSLGILTSARSWSDTISFFRASPALLDRELAELLFELLKGPESLVKEGYVPEADNLIRHSEANYSSYESTEAVLQLISKWQLKLPRRKITSSALTSFAVTETNSAMQSLLRNYLLIRDPLSADREVNLTPRLWQDFGKVIFGKHNHFNQLRTLGQQGAIAIEGMADLGVLKDLNRHRSLERVVPLFNELTSIDAELDRPDSKMYFLCDYLFLPGLESLRIKYQNRLGATYALIRKWLQDTKGKIPAELRNEYAKYLLPYAHATAYRFYGSVDDLQYTVHLRTRNGGHIGYRGLTYAWAQKLAKLNPFWKGVLNNVPKVDPASREQFLDRS